MTQQPTNPNQRVRRQSIRTMVSQAPAVPQTEQAISEATINNTQITDTPTSQQKLPLIAQPEPQPIIAPAKPKRIKLGWPIRAELIKGCKQTALDEGIHDYEVLEKFIEEGLARRKMQPSSNE